MTGSASRQSAMTLYCVAGDPYSHRVQLFVAEKQMASIDIILLNEDDLPVEFLELNPYQAIPTLVERDLVLYQSQIIIEYLEERYPHPTLFPTHPIERARCRLMLWRIDRDWFSLYDACRELLSMKQVDKPLLQEKQQILLDGLLALTPIIRHSSYFFGDYFSVVDCYLAVLLGGLSSIGVELFGKQCNTLRAYAERLFARETYKQSLQSGKPWGI